MTPYTAWLSPHPDDAESGYAWIVGRQYANVADVVAYCSTRANAYRVRDALNALSASRAAEAHA
jgi:LmbE family N-acetylglucosaminyl deacetylase